MTTDVARSDLPALGTVAVVLTADGRGMEAARQAVVSELDAIDRACSRFRPDSDLERLNTAGGRATSVGPVLLQAVEVALRAARLTEGHVDPTVGEAMRVLGYDRDFASLPPSGPPVVRLTSVPGWQLVELDSDRQRIRVPAGVQLDLGATAKALAADRAAHRASEEAGCGVLVSVGGDISTAGDPPPEGWAVGISDWHGADPDETGATVRIDSGGLATSGTTVRRWYRGHERLHHVIDPATGRPASVVWRTATVAAASCVDANVASTAAIIRGERSPAWLESIGLPARLVRPDGSALCIGDWPRERWVA